MTARLVVLVSGNGSNLQSILDACASGRIDATVVAVVSNNRSAFGLQRASESGVPAQVVEPIRGETREAYDQRLGERVATFAPTVVVLAGWLRVLTPVFLDQFKVMNLHPARPGEFAGLNAIERAFAEWEAGTISVSGVMVHWVPDARVDEGPVIMSRDVPFEPGDSITSFAQRMHENEHDVLVLAINQVLEELSQ